MKKYQAILLVTLMFMLAVYMVSSDQIKAQITSVITGKTAEGEIAPQAEGLTVSRDRAGDLYNWFVANRAPKYEHYITEFDGNAVEYDDLLRLYRSGKMTKDAIAAIIVY